jgi:hypothetical protein
VASEWLRANGTRAAKWRLLRGKLRSAELFDPLEQKKKLTEAKRKTIG